MSSGIACIFITPESAYLLNLISFVETCYGIIYRNLSIFVKTSLNNTLNISK